MYIVLITALGVGGATIAGAVFGFLFKGISHRFSDHVLSFASGVMIAASVIGLILPSIEEGRPSTLLLSLLGIVAGALLISVIDRAVPHLHGIVGGDSVGDSADKVLVFVIAIAIHNIPEGLAAGVGFGAEDATSAFMIASGIALQNLPEGMVLIAPMLSSGISKGRTFFIATLTGVVEIVFTVLGYLTVNISGALLPFFLSLAGGSMIFVICDEMIPESHLKNGEKGPSFAVIFGFCVMLLVDYIF